MTSTALLLIAVLAGASSPPPEPCRVIEPTQAQRETPFSNANAVGPFAMRSQSGSTSCNFRQQRDGGCTLRAPGLIHVTLNGRHTWYQVEAGRDARIDVANGVATCRVVGRAG